MSGTKVVFDTNALIHFFNGDASLRKYTPSAICISVITLFLSFPNITQHDKDLIFEFTQDAEIMNLDSHNAAFIQQIISIRSLYKIKLPDTIIAATAIFKNATLITSDKDFTKIQSLKVSIY